MEFAPKESATPIRQPSTANLFIDSYDRDVVRDLTSSDFQIQKKESILNGFFTRISVVECVLNYNWYNVGQYSAPIPGAGSAYGADNRTITFRWGAGGSGGPTTLTLNSGYYNIAQILDALVVLGNAQTGTTGVTWAVSARVGGGAVLTFTDAGSHGVQFSGTTLAAQLGLPIGLGNRLTVNLLPNEPLVGTFRYIDIVSPTLTYNQSLKDDTTNTAGTQNVLVRWYMDLQDSYNPVFDTYGFPVYLTYNSFNYRRAFPVPKQIKWIPNQPLGNLQFQLIGSEGTLITQTLPNNRLEFYMTLQVSEV